MEKSAKKILTLKIRGYSIENSVPQPLIFVQKNSSQIFHKIISTHLLTLLIIGVILQLEQRKGNKKKEKVPNPQGSGTQHIGFLRQCLNIFYECLLKGDMTYDVT